MVFLPLADHNRLRTISFQYVTVALIAACVVVFLWQESLTDEGAVRAIYAFGMIPSVLFGQDQLPPSVAVVPAPATLVTSMFLHGGWLHLGGNMLYLWIFGDNVEDELGHGRYLLFYLLCGVIAALAQAIAAPGSDAPTVGASGAIAGVLGGYLVRHPFARVTVLAFVVLVELPALIVIGGWIVLQFMNGVLDQGGEGPGGGVAWWAHIGGFAAGALLINIMRPRRLAPWS
ncbi:MAG TPA: rhomboid family intramembrane serine protease [Alphaproteobacteria bacterium]|jgi:membrane associated rhomboid family serine protease|nr:rhomboid family intramembrane serine protease [Alphaproteobacteria bacterium]